MKPLKSIVPLIVAASISFTAAAQQQQANPQNPPAAAKQQTATGSRQESSPKVAWEKQYNVWKPSVDKYMKVAKENEDKYPDFNKEVKSLDDMTTTYKQKIERYDHATDQEKPKYADMMRTDAANINTQAAKVKAMYDKNWPQAAEKKEAPKK